MRRSPTSRNERRKAIAAKQTPEAYREQVHLTYAKNAYVTGAIEADQLEEIVHDVLHGGSVGRSLDGVTPPPPKKPLQPSYRYT